MSTLSLKLSDDLFALRRRFSEFDMAGRVLTGADVRALMHELKELAVLARSYENELSRHRWNAEAIKDLKRLAAQGEIVVAASMAPGSNVRLFPATERPFDDGRRA